MNTPYYLIDEAALRRNLDHAHVGVNHVIDVGNEAVVNDLHAANRCIVDNVV